jgi:23S rRNA (cytosine1962-C5)-methyltransferase
MPRHVRGGTLRWLSRFPGFDIGRRRCRFWGRLTEPVAWRAVGLRGSAGSRQQCQSAENWDPHKVHGPNLQPGSSTTLRFGDTGRTAPAVPKVTIKSGHVRPIWAGHPWVYAQAIECVQGGAAPGDVVDVVDPQGKWLGRGLYSPGTAIPVRICTRVQTQDLNQMLFEQRIVDAIRRRRALGLPSERTNAFRVINGEGDDFPGLVVDKYGDIAVIQISTIGVKLRETPILDTLQRHLSPRCIVDRTSARQARTERFTANRGIVRGEHDVRELDFSERGFEYAIPLELGQKTGFYLDQRTLRGRVEQLSQGRSVLDVFSYVGPFALAAARGGAGRVTAVDSNPLALEIAAQAAAHNGLSGRIDFVHDDAFEALKRAGRTEKYDLVICDPPKLAPSKAASMQALKYMRGIAATSCRAVSNGGALVLCSCSAALGLNELTRALALGARDVNVAARVLERWHQGPDHPVIAAFPEGSYLCAVIAEISTVV